MRHQAGYKRFSYFNAVSPWVLALALAGLSPGLAQAQAQAQTQTQTQTQIGAPTDGKPVDSVVEEVVVTGTLLRGGPPVGSNVIGLGADSVVTTGAITSNELLATLPQVTNYFNKVPGADLSGPVNQLTISRPNLRNISPNNAAASATLILVDGHRVATVGTRQASVDPDMIPTGAIARVEVVTEGGSATYGADAVAGVINFITRKRFDGLKIDARYGFADHYWQTDASITAGKDWGSGSGYLSYTFAKNDALYGRERDFIRGVDYSSKPYTALGRACDASNVSINTTFSGFTVFSKNYAYPGLVAGTFNACDTTDNAAAVPAAERNGVMAGLSQDLTDTLSVDMRAYYSRRETLAKNTLRGTVNVGASNPYYILPPGVSPVSPPFAQQQAVNFSFAPVLGRDSAPASTLAEVWGANAEFTKDLGGGWRARGLFNYSGSNSAFELVAPNGTRLNAAGSASTTATAINPYDLAATVNKALIADIADNALAGQARDELANVRAIADGNLFDLPAGPVRLAVGYEFIHEAYKQRYESDIRRGSLGTYPYSAYSRDVHAVFGEVQVPVFGETGQGQSLVLSASGRYDHYSDFGGTFNPKIGATYKPLAWLSLRGNWGTSFNAPTPLDQLGSQRNTLDGFPFVAFPRPGDTLPGGSITCCATIGLQGSRPNLKPQTADTWSVGFEMDPPAVTGLHASLSYYNVKFTDMLGTPTPNVGIFTSFPDNIVTSVTGLSNAQLQALKPLAANGTTTIDQLIASGQLVYEFVDFRTGNFGVVKVSGLDFAASYERKVGFGSIDLSVSGNYRLTYDVQASETSAVVDTLATENPKLLVQTALGTTIGPFRAQATWNHTQGYDILPTRSDPVQDRVKAFNTVNLFFKYDVQGQGPVLKDLSLSLNINNVFDQDPPILRRNDQNENGYANGFTLGRLVTLGVSKTF